jgi:capsular polysaccharide biosynthesis protein
MKTSEIRRALRRRWPATLAVVVLAIVMAVVIHSQLSTVPTGQATTQILVDTPSSSLVNVNVSATGLTAQASVLAQAMTSQAVLEQIAKSAGVPIGSVSAQGPFNGAGEVLDIPTPSEARALQVVSIKAAYHVAFVAQTNVPIITVTVTGPNPTAAGHIADAVLPGTDAWLSTISSSSTVPQEHRLVLRQLGDAQAGPVNSRTAEEIAVVGAIAILILGLVAVALVDRRLEDRRELRRRVSELGELEQAFERGRPADEASGPASRHLDSAAAPREDSFAGARNGRAPQPSTFSWTSNPRAQKPGNRR